MTVFKSRELWIIVDSMGEFEQECRDLQQAAVGAKPHDTLLKNIVDILKQAWEFCVNAGFRAAADKIALINVYLEFHLGEADCSSLRAELRNADEAIMADYWNIKLIQINETHSSLTMTLSLAIQSRTHSKAQVPI